MMKTYYKLFHIQEFQSVAHFFTHVWSNHVHYKVIIVLWSFSIDEYKVIRVDWKSTIAVLEGLGGSYYSTWLLNYMYFM